MPKRKVYEGNGPDVRMRPAGGRVYIPLPPDVKGSAYFSHDRECRYWLVRDLPESGQDPLCAFVGLNPSTADADGDDPTVERCWKRAKEWGFGRMVMLNLFAYRDTFPAGLRTAEARGIDVVGDNDSHLDMWAKATGASTGSHRHGQGGMMIVAWGGGLTLPHRTRAHHVASILRQHGPLYCLGTTSDGWPRHPSRVRRDAEPEPWGPFSIADLRARGFIGFVPVAQLDEKPVQVPGGGGAYAVVYEGIDTPRFLERGEAASWKGKDPNVSIERLRAEWVPGVQTLYLGDAASLCDRIGELAKFSRGRGQNVRHWGGRLLWQVDGCQDLLVAWKVEPYSTALEHDLLEEFIGAHERLPFANLKRGSRNALRPMEPPSDKE